MLGTVANVKWCNLYDTESPSEQHPHNLFIIYKYLWNSNAECFNMYITNLLFSKLIMLQVSMGLLVKVHSYSSCSSLHGIYHFLFILSPSVKTKVIFTMA